MLAFTDGKAMVPMVSSMDHKRAHDGDTGLNTGGMGTICPQPLLYPGSGRALHGGNLPAHHAGYERRGAYVQGLPLLRPDAHQRRSQSNRIQLPLWRPGNASGAAASENRSFHHHAGSGGGTSFRNRRALQKRRGLLCHSRLGRLPESYEKGKVIDLGGADASARYLGVPQRYCA